MNEAKLISDEYGKYKAVVYDYNRMTAFVLREGLTFKEAVKFIKSYNGRLNLSPRTERGRLNNR